jgi:hypothetical protein
MFHFDPNDIKPGASRQFGEPRREAGNHDTAQQSPLTHFVCKQSIH